MVRLVLGEQRRILADGNDVKHSAAALAFLIHRMHLERCLYPRVSFVLPFKKPTSRAFCLHL